MIFFMFLLLIIPAVDSVNQNSELQPTEVYVADDVRTNGEFTIDSLLRYPALVGESICLS